MEKYKFSDTEIEELCDAINDKANEEIQTDWTDSDIEVAFNDFSVFVLVEFKWRVEGYRVYPDRYNKAYGIWEEGEVDEGEVKFGDFNISVTDTEGEALDSNIKDFTSVIADFFEIKEKEITIN